MPKRAIIHARASKDAILRARCDTVLKTLAHQAATRLGVDESDIIRMAVRDFAVRTMTPMPIPAHA